MPPLRLLGVKRAAWCEEDRLLAVALQLDEDSRCGGCGQYAVESMDDDMDGWYEAKTVYCYGCAARDRHAEESKNADHGARVRIENTRPVGR